MASELSANKAKKMLREGIVRGEKLTDKQKRYFGWVASGKKQDGGVIVDPNGYRVSNMDNWQSQMLIPSNIIDTTDMAFPIFANNQLLQPNTGSFVFPNTDFVLETPAMGKYRNGLPERGMRWGGMMNRKKKKMQAGGLQPPVPASEYRPNMGIPTQTDQNVLLADLINYSVANNQNPLNTDYGRILRSTNLSQSNRDLISDILLYNQRPDNVNRSPEQRLQSYYDIPSRNQGVQQLKDQLKPMGGGPVPFFRNSPDVNIQNLLAAKMKKGGKMCFACGGKYRF